MTGRSNGGPDATPPLIRAVILCKDGEWHDLEEILYEVGKVILPGQAMRRAERNRRDSGGPKIRTKGELSRVMAAGKRSLARDFVKMPWFEIVPYGPNIPKGIVRKVRLVQMPARIDLTQENIGRMRWAE